MPGSGDAEEAAVKLVEDENFGTYDVWMYSIVGAILVGFSGILPLLILPIEAGPSLRHGAPAARLKLMLSFAVGSLLGDVFCHLLPEIWNYLDTSDHRAHTRIGLWVIGGLLFFMIVQKIMGDETEFEPLKDTCDEISCSNQETQQTEQTASHRQSQSKKNKSKHQKNKQSQTLKQNSHKQSSQSQSKQKNSPKQNPSHRTGEQPENSSDINSHNNTSMSVRTSSSSSGADLSQPHIKVSGYLNLFANVVDNFTHGLAVAGSFLVSKRVGMLTTGAILVHEIPHEVGDFAILLRSGFDRWKAAKAQVLTATGGVFGAITMLTAEQAGERTVWILAFTSGGFLYIALVTVVPDLLQEKHGRESLKQIACLLFGILCMVVVTYLSG
ncbi:hypothetical protein ACOMHN_035830 [Nucella lapillus]